MKYLTIRSKSSLYNQQKISHVVSSCSKTSFKIKRKGKHCFNITFSENVPASTLEKVSFKLGLEISYKSDKRYTLTDNFDKYLN
jgi:hypothetical protein